MGMGVTYCYREKRHDRAQRAGGGGIGQYAEPQDSVHVIANHAFTVNVDNRAQTGNVVVTTAADQIQYLIPMVEQAPGEYMEAVTRNKDYAYAPPLQPPADYGVIDESGDAANSTPGAGGWGAAGVGKRKGGGGRDLDPNGYVVDASTIPSVHRGGGGTWNVHAGSAGGMRVIPNAMYGEACNKAVQGKGSQSTA
jgi:hypothetical protein